MLLLLLGCYDSSPPDGEPHAGGGPDTAIDMEWFTGEAVVGDTFEGTESWQSTTMDGSKTYCTIQYVLSGAPREETCRGCEFSFDVATSDGAMQGQGCAGLGWTDGMFDGDVWPYSFAERYRYYYYGYAYDVEDVLLLGYDYRGQEYWWPVADATWDGTNLAWESRYTFHYTYYAP